MGTIGYVNAAFELKEQVDNGEIPEPELVGRSRDQNAWSQTSPHARFVTGRSGPSAAPLTPAPVPPLFYAYQDFPLVKPFQ